MPIRLTPAVKVLLIACFACFLVQQTGDQFFGTHLIYDLGLVPSSFFSNHHFWQIFTYSFVHHDVVHLFFNLMMLAFIGGELEVAWGTSGFLKYYFCCVLSAALFYLSLQLVLRNSGIHIPMLGASGGIYGLLMAYGLIFGERTLLFMMLFPIKAKYFIWILALIELLTTVYSPGSGLASLAHLGGMGAGFFYLWIRATLILAKNRKEKRAFFVSPKKRRANHLKLIVNNDRDLDNIDQDSEDGPKTWH